MFKRELHAKIEALVCCTGLITAIGQGSRARERRATCYCRDVKAGDVAGGRGTAVGPLGTGGIPEEAREAGHQLNTLEFEKPELELRAESAVELCRHYNSRSRQGHSRAEEAFMGLD